MTTDDDHTTRKIYTLKQWCQKHPFDTEAGLRHLIFHATVNGFDRVLRRKGRRLLIDEQQYFEWLDQQPIIKT